LATGFIALFDTGDDCTLQFTVTHTHTHTPVSLPLLGSIDGCWPVPSRETCGGTENRCRFWQPYTNGHAAEALPTARRSCAGLGSDESDA
jgi:hypothetical protein